MTFNALKAIFQTPFLALHDRSNARSVQQNISSEQVLCPRTTSFDENNVTITGKNSRSYVGKYTDQSKQDNN